MAGSSHESRIRQGAGRKSWYSWAVLATFLLCLVVGSWLPASHPLMVFVANLPVSDKVLHFLTYLGLTSIGTWGVAGRGWAMRRGSYAFVFGLVMEAGQHFSPGRTIEVGDIVANGLGVIGGLIVWQVRTNGRASGIHLHHEAVASSNCPAKRV